ncbi:MAG: flagellar hook-associated protein FlgK [Planctomycetaceae bacterium]
MSSLQVAVFAMRASQAALQTIGNNLANVRTPGYHRQLVELTDRTPQIIDGLSLGKGVEVAQIRRLRDDALEAVLLQATADQGQQTARLDTLRQIESLLTPGQGTLHAEVQNFFNKWDLLAAEPAEGVRRRDVLQSAGQIANEINSLSRILDDLKLGLRSELESAVAEVNTLSKGVASLNREILIAETRGVTPNDLLDQRDQLVSRLAGLIDADVVNAGATKGVRLANGEALITTSAKEIALDVDALGSARVFVEGFNEPVQLTSGRLAGLVESNNVLIQRVKDQLAEVTSSLIHAVNSVHATGFGAGAGATQLLSTRPVIPTNVPLIAAESQFPIQDGELFLGVTDNTTGTRTLYRIPVNPSADSIDGLAATFDAVTGITSSVNPSTGQLRIDADAGFTFDFTGALPTEVTVAAAAGTSIPRLAGQYVGTANDEWTLTVSGTGNVGVDAGLVLEVRNQGGVLLESFAVGTEYAPGDPLQLPDGVILRVPAGTLNNGDTFRVSLAADSDTSGFLAAVGAFDLFTGNRPGAVAVNPLLVKYPDRLSVSQTGEPGDNRIAARLAALSREQLLSGGTATFVEFLSLASAESGLQVAQSANELEGLRQLNDFYTQQRESLSGVNPDEELVRMLEFQRMYQASARFLTSVNDTLDVLFNIFR